MTAATNKNTDSAPCKWAMRLQSQKNFVQTQLHNCKALFCSKMEQRNQTSKSTWSINWKKISKKTEVGPCSLCFMNNAATRVRVINKTPIIFDYPSNIINIYVAKERGIRAVFQCYVSFETILDDNTNNKNSRTAFQKKRKTKAFIFYFPTGRCGKSVGISEDTRHSPRKKMLKTIKIKTRKVCNTGW